MVRTERLAVAGSCVFPFFLAALLPGCTSSSPKSESSVLRSLPSQQSDAGETTEAVFQVHDRMMAKESMGRMREIAIGVEKYAVAQNAYPNATTMGELIGLLVPRYADVLPTVDAWGTAFTYAVTTDHEHYRLMSAGANRTFQIEFLVSPIGSLHPLGQMDFEADIVFEDGVFVQWPEVRH